MLRMSRELPQHLVTERDAVLALIAESFRDVSRAGGVSWSESVVIDGFGSKQQCEGARDTDCDRSWQELVDDPSWKHDAGVGGFSFLDPIGFRYYIPGAMTRCARGSYNEYTAYALTCNPQGEKLRDYMLEKWSLLNDEQSRCIARFLRFMIAIKLLDDDDPDAVDWLRAYDRHWRSFE